MEKIIDQTPTEKIIQEVWNRLHASKVIPWDAPMGVNEAQAVKFLASHKQPVTWWLDASTKTDEEIWAEAMVLAAAKDMSTPTYPKVVDMQVVKEDPVAAEVTEIALKLEEVTTKINKLVRKVWDSTDTSNVEEINRTAELTSKLVSKVTPFTTEAANLRNILMSYSKSLPTEEVEEAVDEDTKHNLFGEPVNMFDGPGIYFDRNIYGFKPLGIKIEDDEIPITDSVKTWFQLYRSFCEYFIARDTVKFSNIVTWRTPHGRTVPISLVPTNYRKPFELLPGIFTESSGGSTQYQSAMANILEYYGISKDQVRIYGVPR